MKRFKLARLLQRFVSINDPIAKLLDVPRYAIPSAHHRELRAAAMESWRPIARLVRAGDLDELLEPFVFTFSSPSEIWRLMEPSVGVVIRSLHSCVMQVAVARLSA